MKRFTDRDIKIIENRHFGATHVIPPARKPMDHEESRIQISVLNWWRSACVQFNVPEILLFAIPNGGKRGVVTGAIMKREGVRPGVCDLFLACPNTAGHHGLFMEMKKPLGAISGMQEYFIETARGKGYVAFACYSLAQASGLITDYLSGKEFHA